MSGKMGSSDMHARLLDRKEEEEENEVNMTRKVIDESKKIWIVAAPAMFTRFSTFGVAVITQAFVGHIGATELAAYALIQTVFLRFANGILLGMASALETLCGQAFGAKQHHMLGVYLQRSWIVLTICAFLLLPVFIFATPILKLLGQQDDTAEIGGYIAIWFIPMLFGMIVSFTCQMYLQSQSKNTVISYLAAATLIIHLFFSWLLVTKLELGLTGAMISTVIAYWIPNLGQIIYVTGGWCPETWHGLSWLAFSDLLPVIKLSLSSGVMLCLELWYNSILVLLTANMPNANVAIDALSICLNINGWEMMIALGFLAAAGVRVSNELGRGSAKSAKFSILVIVLQSLSIGVVLFAVFLIVRGKVAYIFTNDAEVVSAVAQLSPLLACSMLLNSVQPVLSGVAVGSGWQGKVAYVNITCYYIIGIPLGVLLGYVVHFQVTGIWLGMLFGTLVQSIVLLIITMRTDWDQQVTLAQQRVKKWFVPPIKEANGDEVTQAA